jgi:geranylgeranylglycerol-phosphate geranylgeranyltransferase
MRAKAVQAFSKLIRLDNSLFGAFAVLLSGLYAGDLRGFQFEYLVAFLIVFLSAAGSFAINDYCDFEVDKRNNRHDRPLVLGLPSRRAALMTGLVSFSLILLLSLFLNLLAISLVLVSLPLFFIYSLGLKRMILVKNILIAYAYVATILFGSLVSDAILEPLIVYFATMAFIVGLAFEITLDIGDIEGDKELGIETISTRFGTETAAQLSVVLYGVIMILDPLPFFIMINPSLYMDYAFLLLILIPVVSYFLISKSLMKDQSKKNVFQLKKRVFVTMQVGCTAYLIGVLL